MSELVDDKTIMRRLGVAVLAMCGGALSIVVIAVTIGNIYH